MASIGRAAGNAAMAPKTHGRRTGGLLSGQHAIEAAHSSVNSVMDGGNVRGETDGGEDGMAKTQESRHTRWRTYDSMDAHGIGLGTEETDPLLDARTRSGEANDEDEAVVLPRRCANAAVFPLLQRVRDDVRSTIDTHLEWHELTALEINYAVVRPLALKYSTLGKSVSEPSGERAANSSIDILSVIFVLLVNRLQFQRDAERDLALQGINTTRAALCELLAMKLLRTFAKDPIQLVTALTFPFSPFQGASEEILAGEGLLEGKQAASQHDDPGPSMTHFASPAIDPHTRNEQSNRGENDRTANVKQCSPVFGPGQCSSALELAILTKAKKLIKTPLCQRTISGIYEGRIVLSYQSAHAIVDDSYKKRPLGIYDPATAPFLDHHRLRVPLIRSRIEFFNFCVLLVLYVWCLGQKRADHWTAAETIYTVWAASFALDEVAQMQEHGIVMYLSSLYNMLDLLFCIISATWLGLRASALVQGDASRSALSFDTLSLGAILLCPRVASALVQDNVILLALKAMLSEFTFFMMLAIVCFSGFVYTFWQLSSSDWTVGRIVWLMTKVWLGNSYVLFDTAQEFSAIYGPFLMVFFAVMANTLLLTILISLLSNTFSVVAQNAVEEAMYQFACKTVSGISSEALLSYQMMPLNLVALLLLGPASFVLTPRYLHKANVYLLRATSWPILLIIRIGLYTPWSSAVSRRRRHKSIGTGSDSHRHIGASSAEGDSHGKGTVSTYLLSLSGGAQVSNFFDWLPLPRSRASPDRDIFEAAFARAKAESRSKQAASTNTGAHGQHHEGVPAETGIDHTNDTKRASSTLLASSYPETPRGSAHGQNFGGNDLDQDEENEGTHITNGSGYDVRSTESPLARLFGRALRRRNDSPPRTRMSQAHETSSLPHSEPRRRWQRKRQAQSSTLQLDEDAVHAGETAAEANEGDDGNTKTSKNEVAAATEDAHSNRYESDTNDELHNIADDGSGENIEEQQGQASAITLIRDFSTRLEAYEQRQQRIENLLSQLVEKRSASD